MRTTLDIPDEVMTSLKVKAAQEGKKMKTLVEEALREFLQLQERKEPSSEALPTFSVGKVLKEDMKDIREEVLDARGDRY